MNWRRIFIAALIVIVLGVVVFLFFRSSIQQDQETTALTPSDPDAVTVNLGRDKVDADGELVPLRQAQLSALQPGEVVKIFVQEGDLVGEGDELLLLDTTDQEISLKQALAGKALAEANLANAEASLQAAQAARQQAELAVEAAQASLALVEAGPSDEQIALAELTVEAAEAGIRAAAGNQALVLEAAPSSQILAAQAQLRAAQAQEKQVRDALGAASGSEATRLEEQLVAAVAAVNAAQASLNEALQGATRSEQVAASSAVSQASAQRQEAEAQLALLEAGAREEQRQQARIAIRQAQATLEEADLAVSQAQTSLSVAEAGLVQTEAALAAAQVALSDRTLVAPFAGTVARLPLEIGEVVAPGFPAVVIADLGNWLIKTTDLGENKVASIARGFPVEVSVDAFPGFILAGTVTDIATISTVNQDENNFEVTISLNETGELPLRWGMTAFVTIDVTQ